MLNMIIERRLTKRICLRARLRAVRVSGISSLPPAAMRAEHGLFLNTLTADMQEQGAGP
jgi:hypothetical protein